MIKKGKIKVYNEVILAFIFRTFSKHLVYYLILSQSVIHQNIIRQYATTAKLKHAHNLYYKSKRLHYLNTSILNFSSHHPLKSELNIDQENIIVAQTAIVGYSWNYYTIAVKHSH
ncbi:hypothetical protein FHX64_001527 [Microbacter margulisiae]|uniref:Uncharacterized protein n=1 Tax=Microbacter margulisiae TaxID=1350067 RepID=A0A7W5DQS4_9PORP|nr:hypothetical protein [Microbacter margulisiae]